MFLCQIFGLDRAVNTFMSITIISSFHLSNTDDYIRHVYSKILIGAEARTLRVFMESENDPLHVANN